MGQAGSSYNSLIQRAASTSCFIPSNGNALGRDRINSTSSLDCSGVSEVWDSERISIGLIGAQPSTSSTPILRVNPLEESVSLSLSSTVVLNRPDLESWPGNSDNEG